MNKNLWLIRIFPLIAALSLCSCAVNQGNANIKDFGRYGSLEKGKSDKRAVYQGFGQPHDVWYTSGDSQWTYYNAQGSMNGASFIPFVGIVAGGMNTNTTTADFFFDKKDRLINYSTAEKTKFVNSFVGVARGISSLSNNKPSGRVKEEMEKYEYPFDTKEALKAKDIGTIIGSDPRGRNNASKESQSAMREATQNDDGAPKL